jgi:two-component system sensor histidine kinase KdpD
LDWITGAEVTLAPFCLMSVLLITWNVGRRWGVVTAGFATVVAQLADIQSSGTDVFSPSWNAIVWFAAYLLVVWLLSELKVLIASQRDEIEQQAEVSDDLRMRNEIKDVLLHAVSHDLKGPLAGILGAMQTIRRAEQLHLSDQEMEELYRVIEGAGQKANRLIDDLLDLDRLRRGQMQPERRPTDVAELARHLAQELPPLDGHPVRVDGDTVMVDVDPAKVERIVENLLVNAGRHTPAGTPIHVRIHGRTNGVVLEVEDAGPGVPISEREEIFEPFRQGEGARGGVGVGLSLVRRFAQLHGGTAFVEDAADGGARFVVTLPGDVSDSDVVALRAV